MNRILLSVLCLLITVGAVGQDQNLPIKMTQDEATQMKDYLENYEALGITDPPDGLVRVPAEWEEAKALVITWTSYTSILTQIVEAAVEEVDVYIVCSNANSVENTLTNAGVDVSNVHYLVEPYNSVWIRDYGQWSAYYEDVDSLVLIDWIYNRPRPADDVVPQAVADEFGLTLHETTEDPNDLVATGGNFMTDGMRTGFSSELIVMENEDKTVEKIEEIMEEYMGMTRYVLMDVLPYDGIHHIDMHMKLLDEETILVGEYPDGVADGPQIEANIQYILDNYDTPFGNPYEIIRIQMPPDQFDDYPDQNGYYRTYANALFINKTVLVPTYEPQYDNPALEIWEESMRGYNVVGINCNSIIPAGGAIHCITKLVHVNDPIMILHSKLQDAYDAISHLVGAQISHKTGIANAIVYYRTEEGAPFTPLAMDLVSPAQDIWAANIPGQPDGTNVQYYIEAFANSGKNIARPITAPDGYWDFDVFNSVNIEEVSNTNFSLNTIYPNPSRGITVIPISSPKTVHGTISLTDMSGKEVMRIHEGEMSAGTKNYYLDSSDIASGAYLVKVESGAGTQIQKLIVR